MKMKIVEVSILCLLCVFCPLRATTLPPDGTDFSSPDCKTLICEQVHEQAKGLSKLAILDEFVSQTVFLLKNLMKNIDGELEKSASSLLRYIHPNCNSTRDILNEVIQKQKEKLVRASPAFSENIDPMSEEETSRSYGNEYEGQQHYDTDGGDRDSQEVGRPEDESNTFDDGSYKPGSGGAGGYHKTRENSKFGNSRAKELSWGSSSTHGQQEEDDSSVRSSGHWTGNSGQQETQDIDWSSSGTKHRPPPSSGNGKHPHGTGRPHGTHNHAHHHHCHGVNKGSTYWVPGLDQWCVDNCKRGYCPRTHCIC